MGCCVSATHGRGTSTKSQNFQVGSEPLKPKSTLESRAPPPSVEEETVKEVLSEIPKLKPPPTPPLQLPQLLQPIKNEQKEIHLQETNKKKIHIEPPFLDEKIEPNRKKNEFIFQEEEISEQLSEVCSLSCSETVSTTTFNNDKRDDADDDDGEEVKQRAKKSPAAKLAPRNRGVSSDFGPRRDRIVGKSPDKRNNASRTVRSVQSRESVNYQVGRRGLNRPEANGRDPGESSGRRSRSPATTRSTMGRSPSSRRVNRSPSGGRTNLPQSGGIMDMEGKWPSTSTTNDTTTNESLENPLVSLECFIFL
ncbi:uncharacterized protein LOC110603972 [Manihot esculenta]|uniref:Uncharacterized protein n=1 Tax=Manihot esculenta TaxID=3983 RepID=A0A2C9U974_MANES|nr:uncharacterized protein LOC110603972 [Manihot esculenta]OAY26124.1 hypothetical protein MANES_16G023200v8 [Manihot esculenta]